MPHPFVRTALAVMLANTFITAVSAADAPKEVPLEDEAAVVVTATRFDMTDVRTPANISVITRDDIRNTPAFDLPAILKTRAGVDVRTLYGSLGVDATVGLRGFGDTAGSNTLILLDGQRLNPVDSGAISWSAIPLESIRRIEIIRGAGTVLYGDRASGGIVNIITDKSGSPRAGIAVTSGSYGERGADVYGAAGSDLGYLNVFGHYGSADGWRRNSQQDQQSLAGRAGVYIGASTAFVDYAAYKDSSGLPGYLRRAAYLADPRSSNTLGDNQRRDGYRLRPGVKLVLSDTLSMEAELADAHEDQHANYASFGSVADRTNDTFSFTPRLRWQHGLGTLASETVFGVDYYTGKLDARYTTAPFQSAKQTSTAFYFQNTTALDNAWSVTLGGRNQRMEQNVHQDAYPAWFAPALDGNGSRSRDAYDLGASYTGQGWRAYAKTGTTFRFANTDELFSYDQLTGNPVFAGDLRPQHGTIQEIGGSLGSGPLQGRASLYRLNMTDEIGYDGAAGTNVNFAPTRRDGLEAELDWRVAERLKARWAYAHVDARFRDGVYSGKQMPLVPQDKFTIQATWDAGTAGAYTAVANYVGARPFSGDFANVRDKLPGYATLDLQAAWNLRPWTVTARLLNAFDKRYASFAGYSPFIADYYYYPADGRSFHLGARYDFK